MWKCEATPVGGGMGMQNGAAALEDSLAVSYKNKHRLSGWSSYFTPKYVPKWAENTSTHTHTPHTHCTWMFIAAFSTKESFNEWIKKQIGLSIPLSIIQQ